MNSFNKYYKEKYGSEPSDVNEFYYRKEKEAWYAARAELTQKIMLCMNPVFDELESANDIFSNLTSHASNCSRMEYRTGKCDCVLSQYRAHFQKFHSLKAKAIRGGNGGGSEKRPIQLQDIKE